MKKLRDDRGLVQLVVRGVRYVLYPLINDVQLVIENFAAERNLSATESIDDRLSGVRLN